MLLFILPLVILVAGETYKVDPVVPLLNGKIVGGKDTSIERNAHQLSLEEHTIHICGASIISETRALTAAHCTYGLPASSLAVRAGSSTLGTDGQVIQVSSYLQHPKYDHATLDYDVSVLILGANLQFGPGVQAITLHEVNHEMANGVIGTVTGWGATSSEGSPSLHLQIVEVPKFDNAQCKSVYGRNAITERMTCHGYKEGEKDACQGDSGGPLIAGGKQVGIVSWGEGCADADHPGVYTKIANEEINEFIKTSL